MMRAVFLSVVFLAACTMQWPHGHRQAPPPNPIAGMMWQRNDDANAGPYFPTLAFALDRATGYAGCNQWSGKVSQHGTALHIHSIRINTRRRCSREARDTEHRMFAAISRTSGYRLENGELVFLDSRGGQVARFARADTTSHEIAAPPEPALSTTTTMSTATTTTTSPSH